MESLISKEIENTKGLNLSVYNEFDWDSLIILSPYTSLDLVEKQFYLDLSNVSNSIEMLDSINLIIFLQNNKAVKYVELSRNIADFDSNHEIIDKKNAQFILEVEKGAKILKISRL
ncbi:MAG: hypothetical protein Q4F57_08720 [Weeksellaceae bacterium]|nr:hypothetical protein [Weeksellaceae bacterium]